MPSIEPEASAWLDIDEAERMDLVLNSSGDEEEELPDEGKALHALMHLVVENQIAMDVNLVRQTVAKLMHQGLARHEAIHAV